MKKYSHIIPAIIWGNKIVLKVAVVNLSKLVRRIVMGKIVTIGEVNPPSSLDLIDKEIIKLTNKKYPKILYVPTAGGDNLGYCDFYREIYEGRFGCEMDVLFLINETPTEKEIREKIFSSDIIYVGGGLHDGLEVRDF
jgi:hypothetical protein